MITAIATGDKNVDKSLQNICAVIVRLSDAINNINTAISTLNGNLDKKFELIKNGIDEINTDITAIEGDISTIQGDISDISTEISAMADSFETKTLLVGDVTAGNYVEIKENGEIELHGTNTIQINSGILYLKNGSTTERIRADSGNFYIENQTSPGVWDELLSGF